MMTLRQEIEALLFISGEEGMTVPDLARLLQVAHFEVNDGIEELQDFYERNSSGLMIIETGQKYKFVTKPELYETVKKFAQSDMSQRLSQAALEILAVIAYNQPATRLDIEEIRGVNSSGPLQKLMLHGLVKEAGRLEMPGRPIVYETTPYFLDYFGLSSLDDLPKHQSGEEEEERNLFFDSFQISLDEF